MTASPPLAAATRSAASATTAASPVKLVRIATDDLSQARSGQPSRPLRGHTT